jgi:hypothetical protein
MIIVLRYIKVNAHIEGTDDLMRRLNEALESEDVNA